MNQDTWTAVDSYITTLFLPDDPALEAAQTDSAAAGLPSISVSPLLGKLLMLLARSHGAGRILEIGTLGGYSTIWLARALSPGGRLITLELNPKHAEIARANLERAGVGDRVEVRVGAAAAMLAEMAAAAEAPFDFIFIDADKPGYVAYLEGALALSRPGTLIIADNVIRQGKIVDAANDEENVLAVRRFNERLAAEPRLESLLLQTVGSKGYDGLAMALVSG